MGIIASNAYLASIFTAGTLIGASATYVLLRFRSIVPSTPIEERYKVGIYTACLDNQKNPYY